MNPFEIVPHTNGKNGRAPDVEIRLGELESALRTLAQSRIAAPAPNGAPPADPGDLPARLAALEKTVAALIPGRETVQAPFRIAGESGMPIFEVVLQNGNPMLRLFNTRGIAVAELRTVEDLDGGTAMLVLNNGRGKTCCYATASDDGGGLILLGAEDPDRLVLSGNRDTGRGMIELFEGSGDVRKRIDPYDLRLFFRDLGARLARRWEDLPRWRRRR